MSFTSIAKPIRLKRKLSRHNPRRTERSLPTLLGDRDGAERDYSLKIRRLVHTSCESGQGVSDIARAFVSLHLHPTPQDVDLRRTV